MLRFLKTTINGQKGQALPIVLCLLAIGGLTIAATLDYCTTVIKSSRNVREGVNGLYAAGAGIEHALWSIQHEQTPPTQLTENINQMSVNMNTDNRGTYTVVMGQLIEPGVHSDYLSVDSTTVAQTGKYKYTITVTGLQETTIHLEEVGARLPDGYSYQAGSANSFTENISREEPEITYSQGSYMLRWEFDTPLPSVSKQQPVITQSFYITGEGKPEGEYSWVVASRVDIGAVGEISGALYNITATALRSGDNKTTGEIVADVMTEGEAVYILSWQIVH